MPARPHLVEVAQVEVVLEEELRDRPVGAGIDLGLQGVDVGIERGGLRVLLGIGRDRDLEVADALDAGHEVAGLGVAAGMRPRRRCRRRPAGSPRSATMWRTPGIPVGVHDLVDLVAGGGDAGEVGGRLQAASPRRCARRCCGCARGSSRRRRRSPRRISAAAARGARSRTRGSSPSRRSSAGRTRTRPGSDGSRRGWRDAGKRLASGRPHVGRFRRSSTGSRTRRQATPLARPVGSAWRPRPHRGEPEGDGELVARPRRRGRGRGSRRGPRPGLVEPARHLVAARSRGGDAPAVSRRNSRSCGAKSTTSRRPPGRHEARRLAQAPGPDRRGSAAPGARRRGRSCRARRAARGCRPGAARPATGPARSRLARATDSMAWLASSPTARAARGARSWSMRPGAGAEIEQAPDRAGRRARRGPPPRRSPRARAASAAGPSAARGGRRRPGRPRPAGRARPRAARGPRESGASGGVEPGQQRLDQARPRSSARRKKAQAPSRCRSTSPASTRSLRWREMRGCDWPRMSVRSETDSSPSASSARMRRRVSSAAARRMPRASGNGRAVAEEGRVRHKDIFM